MCTPLFLYKRLRFQVLCWGPWFTWSWVLGGWVIRGTHVSLLHSAVEVDYLLKARSLLHVYFQPLWKLGWLWSCGLKCGPSVLLHWLMRLFLCRDHAVFVAIALQWGKTRGGDALVLFCCSEWFGYPESFMAPYQFWERFFSVSRKNSVGNWTGIALNLYLAFGRTANFTTCIPPWAWAVSPSSCNFFSVFLRVLLTLLCKPFMSMNRFNPGFTFLGHYEWDCFHDFFLSVVAMGV